MKSSLVFSRRTRNSGTQVVKSVVTIGSEVVPPGAETVEQQAEQNPRRESRRSVSTVSVPQSVPLGTPRKPLQGLAVPQFHDFRRIGEKNTENRSSHIPEKRAPARSPHKPCVCLNRSGWATDPQSGKNPPQKPASRLVAGQGRRRFDGERRGGQKEEKQRFFSPIPAEYRRIYYQAGISAAVTSARNSGQRSRKTASFGGFGGSC